MPRPAPDSLFVQPDSRSRQIAAFFERNPSEELTYDDIAIKFNCTLRQAHMAVSYLRQRGEVESTLVIRLTSEPQPQRVEAPL